MFGDCELCTNPGERTILFGNFNISICSTCANKWDQTVKNSPNFIRNNELLKTLNSLEIQAMAGKDTSEEYRRAFQQKIDNELEAFKFAEKWVNDNKVVKAKV